MATPKQDPMTREQGSRIIELLERLNFGVADAETSVSNCLAQLKIANRKLDDIADKR